MAMSSYLPTIWREPFDAQIDRLFDEAFQLAGWETAGWLPACNAYEDENGFCVQLALPGMGIQDVAVQVEGGVLTVKGERKVELSEPARAYHVRELGWGAFSRSFTLPSYADGDKVSASINQGLLSIRVPKREEAKPRRIMIECK